MYRYCDDLETLIDIGLKPEHISELFGCAVSYLNEQYSYNKNVCLKKNIGKRSPNAKDITIAYKLLKRGMSILRILNKFKDKYDVNIIYETLKDKYDCNFTNIHSEVFLDDCALLLEHGLSLRNCAILLTEANKGFCPDHSSLRKRLVKMNKYILADVSSKKTMGNKDKILCLKIIKKYEYTACIEDFIKIYFRYFFEYKANDVCRILINAKDLNIITCNICKKPAIAEKYQKFCKRCRKKDAYQSAS